MKLRLLDLFCGAGGAGEGYRRAGFVVTGVDIAPHRYPPGEFIRADALDVLHDVTFLAGFDVIHASPPCQAYTTMSVKHRGKGGRADSHPDLIPPVRNILEAWAGTYVIENVPGARSAMRGAVTLSGGMFGLGVDRPRLFESNALIYPAPIKPVRDAIGVYGRHHDGRRLWTRADGTEQRAARDLEQARAAMGIPWMDWADLTEAIPPAYTEWVGLQLIENLADVRGY